MKELPVPEADPEDVERDIADILDGPEYDFSDPWYAPITRWLRDLLTDVLEWISRRIGDFFSLFDGIGPGGVGGSGALWQLVGYLIIAGAVLVVARLIWRVVQDRLPKPQSFADEPVVDVDEWRRPKELLADAERFEAEGRWDEALRARYRFVIAELVERNLIENPPGRTTGEYRAEVEYRLPASAGAFNAITETFEDVWYGEAVADRPMVDELRRSGDTVLAAAKNHKPVSKTDDVLVQELVG